MPIKYNLTWADMLSTKIHKVSQKDIKEFNEEDYKIMRIGILIASLASSHSWQTYKAIKENPKDLNKPEVKEEYLNAVKRGWKSVAYSDINEIAQEASIKKLFDVWAFFNVDKEEHSDYKEAWETLKSYFEDSCDDVDNNGKS